MKKLTMISKESVFSGYVKCGMAELADTLANSLAENYNVNLIVANGGSRMPIIAGGLKKYSEGISTIRFAKVNYYIIDLNVWEEKSIEIANSL
jgi:hypothetical protein